MNTFDTIRRIATPRAWLARSLFAIAAAATMGGTVVPNEARASIFVSVNFAPPILPVYAQPVIPGPGYIWTPGYWAYDAASGYYWVPGTWVLPPYVGALWTPGYWGWAGGAYVFHGGYWGLHVGYYGGINYGFGYAGIGYVGGYWGPRGFCYNRVYNRVTNVNVTNVYNKTVVVNNNVSRVSYNGGRGGTTAQPSAQEMRYANQQRTAPVATQVRQQTLASRTPAMRASVNRGNPEIAATTRPGEFGAHAGKFGGASSTLRPTNLAPHAESAQARPAMRNSQPATPTAARFQQPPRETARAKTRGQREQAAYSPPGAEHSRPERAHEFH